MKGICDSNTIVVRERKQVGEIRGGFIVFFLHFISYFSRGMGLGVFFSFFFFQLLFTLLVFFSDSLLHTLYYCLLLCCLFFVLCVCVLRFQFSPL
jgi:hypothetical protein